MISAACRFHAAELGKGAAEEAPEEIERLLFSDRNATLAFRDNIETYAQVDRLLASAEHRRNQAILELEACRCDLGRRVRDASSEIIEGEFHDAAA